ncbi:hypothetical protein ADL06_33480 [Streptomyces sp. NRRL F-6491]|nr:hypothetical protein ADL06_33480 [Streptomyces sp. NRRL F-6491]KOX36078.1 hypothetical protein ADL08_33260 [Streptomyces sp. NRRL F-6492]
MHVASLTLDETNPRHASRTSSLEESIAALLEKGPEKLLRLARDICQHGVNPTDMVIVLVDGDQNVVLEGNRRVAALKLLHNPKLAPTEKLRKQFTAIAKTGEFPRRIMCVITDSRMQAEHWIRLKHTGENSGVGVVRWSTGEASRFSGRSTPTEKARLFIEAVNDWFPDDAELRSNTQTVRDGRITNLGRMIADPAVRNRLGIAFDGDVVLRSYPAAKLLPILTRIFHDLAGPVSVDQIKNKRQREDYLQKVEDELPKLADRLEEDEKYSKSAAGEKPTVSGDATGKAEDGTKPARRKRPDFEKKLFQGVSLRHVSLRTSEVLEEAQRIKIDEMPNVAAIMVRVVVDIVVTEVAEQLGWRRNQDKLKGRIGAVLHQVDPNKDDPHLSNAWRFSQEEDGALVLKTLHMFVHSWQNNPLISEVRKLSMAYGPVLTKADELLEKKKR